LTMNDPNLNSDEQQRKSKLRKFMFLAVVLFVVGFALDISAFFFERHSLQSDFLIGSGGLCCIVACIVLMKRRIKQPSAKGIFKNQFQKLDFEQRLRPLKIVVLSLIIAVVVAALVSAFVTLSPTSTVIVAVIIFVVLYSILLIAQRKRYEKRGNDFNQGNNFIESTNPQSESQGNERLIIIANLLAIAHAILMTV